MNFICLALKTGTLGRNQIKEKEDFLFLEPGTNQSMFKNKQICIQLYLHTVKKGSRVSRLQPGCH